MNQAVLNEKEAIVAAITEQFKEAEASVVVEYRGLSVAEVTELRRNLRKENVEFKVYKNSMAQRAVESLGYGDLKESLKGPNAIAFSKDATAPARVLAEFAKKHEHLVLKSGIVEGKIVDINTLNELASLPNKEGMLSMLLSCLQSPVRSFACVVKAIADKEAEGSEAAPVAEEANTEEAAA